MMRPGLQHQNAFGHKAIYNIPQRSDTELIVIAQQSDNITQHIKKIHCGNSKTTGVRPVKRGSVYD